MLLECVLAILTLCAVAYAYSWNAANPDAQLTGATAIFGGGIAGMIDPSRGAAYDILYTLLVLTYSAFCLTSLDTATRLARFMFQEFWLDGSKGETPENVTGYKKVLANPYVATIITVVLGIGLGMNGYEKIWALFGSANQLLAALGLLAVATWLGRIGKNNKMFLIPHGLHAGGHHCLSDPEHPAAGGSDLCRRRRLGSLCPGCRGRSAGDPGRDPGHRGCRHPVQAEGCREVIERSLNPTGTLPQKEDCRVSGSPFFMFVFKMEVRPSPAVPPTAAEPPDSRRAPCP